MKFLLKFKKMLDVNENKILFETNIALYLCIGVKDLAKGVGPKLLRTLLAPCLIKSQSSASGATNGY